jgi:hypothetical protein
LPCVSIFLLVVSLLLLRVFFFLILVLVLLLRVSLFLLAVLVPSLCGFCGLRLFLVLGRPGFLFLLPVMLILLRTRRNRNDQRQNCGADSSN